MSRCDVAIVGGGFSGCAVVAQLATLADADLSVCLFQSGELGRGAAYGTHHAEHLLNTRAHAMSLFPDDPDHFVRWLGSRAGGNDFVSRRLYGEYVAEVAARAFERRPRFSLVTERVCAVRTPESGGFVLESAGGARVAARAVVLATGNAPPNDSFLPPGLLAHPGYVADPWRFDYRIVAGEVLLVGSGLTALDVLVALEGHGHGGIVHIVSRRGRFPQTHAAVKPYDVVPALDASDTRTLVRSFRRHLVQAQRRGYDWRAVMDAVRPEGETLWRRLPLAERRRFERHVRAHWERHRHRAPEQVDAVRERYRAAGRLFAHSGRIVAANDGIVNVGLAQGGSLELRPDWVVNCTGLGRAGIAADPLLAGLLAAGTISIEPCGLGIQVDASLVPLDRAGRPVAGLWFVGPPVRGSRFEATAVPELRIMAQSVASRVLESLRLVSALTG